MADTLVQTKLHTPRPRSALVQRPRLVKKLDAGLDTSITLISAPAGFGKTTLVADWIARRCDPPIHCNVVWLSLDERDNDPVRFLAYVTAGLENVDSDTGAKEGLRPGRQMPAVETLLAVVINVLSQRPDRVLLVLDDFQAITDAAIHALVSFLVDHMPPQLHLTIITRADPLLPLPRWRSRRELTELHAADLRFTVGETAELLTQIFGMQVSSTDIATLDARTEGWIAGLQLAALSMRDRDDVSRFIASFAGSHRYIMDYLVDEVLQQRPTGTEHFLLRTALLNRMCGSLCDALTGRSDGQATLERLEQANLFIVPLDDQRRWYRYHHLFGDVLRSRFRQMAADRIPHMYRQASEWCERNGEVVEAVDYAILATDFAQAASLIQQHGPRVALNGQLDRALIELARAIQIAEPEGYVRLFGDDGQRMLQLLRQAQSRGAILAYVSDLLLEFSDFQSRTQAESVGGQSYATLIEPLSERELDVLRLVAVGASNRDISQALVITVPTVKKHVSNILGKLGAGNRTQAVALARDWNLY